MNGVEVRQEKPATGRIWPSSLLCLLEKSSVRTGKTGKAGK